MRTQLEEIKIISDLLDEASNKSFRDLEAVNTGSSHKLKEEIINSVCRQARQARRLNQILHSCLEWIIEGRNIQEFYEWKTQQATRTNQPKQDQVESQEELAMLTELIIHLEL